MSKTLGIHDKEAIQAMLEHIESECEKVNVERQYDDMLDECFSFENVGGCFSHMQPSRVLRECDPTAYRCGMNDWLDGERDRLIEIGSDYYDADDVEKAKEEFISERNGELSDMETELEELKEEEDSNPHEVEKLTDEIERNKSAIEACENHAF